MSVQEDKQTVQFIYRAKPGQSIKLCADFLGWKPVKMKHNETTDDYCHSAQLSAGRYQYKFQVNGKYVLDPKNPNKLKNKNGGYNNFLDIGTKTEQGAQISAPNNRQSADFSTQSPGPDQKNKGLKKEIMRSNHFQNVPPSMPVKSCHLVIDDINTEKIKKIIFDAFEKGPFAEFSTKARNVLQKISDMVQRSSWVTMQDDMGYFCDLDALFSSAKKIIITTTGFDHTKGESCKDFCACDDAINKFMKNNALFKRKACLPDTNCIQAILDCKESNYLSEFERFASSPEAESRFYRLCWLVKDDKNYICKQVSSKGKIAPISDKGVNEPGKLGCTLHFCNLCHQKIFTFIPLMLPLDGISQEKYGKAAYLLQEWVSFDLCPEEFADNAEYSEVAEMIKKHEELFDFSNTDGIVSWENTLELFMNGATLWDWNCDRIISKVLNGDVTDYADEISKIVLADLLNCDVVRSDITPAYTDKILSNINMGHWDLWGENAAASTNTERRLEIPCDFIARNPRYDIKDGGKVGIDFGTKSTTVVRSIPQEKMPKPMRIGNSDYSKLPDKFEDYENPTILQFINWKSFIDAYKIKMGRPNTRWADLIMSHAASERLKESEESSLFQTFHSDLKQWAGGNRISRLADLSGEKWTLKPFAELGPEDIDPIEVYAYNIGLFINNMSTGIYLQYELSYPVTYDKDIRQRLRLSFERGIKKSLPISIQNDEEAMKKFYVRFAASEPAAYSLCALKEYGFAPKNGEKYFYGVFDFGGGTSDFDFGVLRESSEEELDEGYDYVLEHFLPSGDKFLGGENILQLLSFEVFKNNKSTMLKEGIPFPRPWEADNTAFAGEEGLISNAPEALLNMKLMMEKLRPIWENSPSLQGTPDSEVKEANNADASQAGLSEEFNSGLLKIKLFDKHGEQKTNIELAVDPDKLRKIIEKRIERGVANFFARLHESFLTDHVPQDVKKINIFLAGNSCRSPYVKKLFTEYIKDQDKNASAFELYAPLGSPEALARMKESGIDVPSDKQELLLKPTGKTGVAFGLIMGSAASHIKIIDQNMDDSGKIAFRFYVGKQQRGIFIPILTMRSELLGEWQRVQSVGKRPVVEIHSSELAEAGTRELPITKTASITIPIRHPAQTDMGLFIRVHSANEIEYVIASSVDAIVNAEIMIHGLEEA